MIMFIVFVIVLCLKVLFYGLLAIWAIVFISEILQAIAKELTYIKSLFIKGGVK